MINRKEFTESIMLTGSAKDTVAGLRRAKEKSSVKNKNLLKNPEALLNYSISLVLASVSVASLLIAVALVWLVHKL